MKLYHYTTIDTLFSLIEKIEIKPEDKPFLDQLSPFKVSPNPSLEELLPHEQRCFERVSLNFWASHINHLNDPSEYKHFSNIYKKGLKRLDLEREVISKACGFIEEVKKWNDASHSIFIFSLSELKDSLLMWRGYGADGNGVALEFNDAFIHQDIYPVQYDSSEFLKKTLSKDNVTNISRGKKHLKNHLVSLNPSVMKFIQDICSTVKHPTYEHEKEWRIVLNELVPEKINYRESGGIITPYVNLPIKLNALKKIIFGPCCKYKLNEKSLKNIFLKKFKFWPQTIKFENSKVPYLSRKK